MYESLSLKINYDRELIVFTSQDYKSEVMRIFLVYVSLAWNEGHWNVRVKNRNSNQEREERDFGICDWDYGGTPRVELIRNAIKPESKGLEHILTTHATLNKSYLDPIKRHIKGVKKRTKNGNKMTSFRSPLEECLHVFSFKDFQTFIDIKW